MKDSSNKVLRTLLVVDAHQMFCDSIAYFFAAREDIACFSAVSFPECLEFLGAHDPVDLVLLSLNCHEITGLDSLLRIKALYPQTKVCLVSGKRSPILVEVAASLGADGVLSKYTKAQDFERAVDDMLFGTTAPGGAAAGVDGVVPVPSADEERVLEVLRNPDLAAIARQLLSGSTNKEMEERLDLPQALLKSRQRNLYRRLGVTNRTAAALLLSRVIADL